jgi:hypothetical protein
MQRGKKSVFLEMSYLVNTVMRQFKGPEVKRHIYPSDGVMRTVTVSLEVHRLHCYFRVIDFNLKTNQKQGIYGSHLGQHCRNVLLFVQLVLPLRLSLLW